VQAGYWMGGGKIPFGFDYDSAAGVLVPNADAERVRLMYQLYLGGYSAQAVADITGLKYDKQVTQILSRKSNIGVIHYNGEDHRGLHEPIIDEDTFNRTQDMIKTRAKHTGGRAGHLLSGLIYCGVCGARMRYQKWGKQDCKIVCYSQDKNKVHLIKDPNCSNMKLWASDVEDIIIKNLFHYSFEQTKTEIPQISNMNLLDILHEQYDNSALRLRRLYSLYSESEDEVLLQTIGEIKREMKNIQTQIENETEKNKNQMNFLNIKKTIKICRFITH